MQRWAPLRHHLQVRPWHVVSRPSRNFTSTVTFGVPYTEHFQVPCASSGSVTVRYVHVYDTSTNARCPSRHTSDLWSIFYSLHNVPKHDVSSPLVINIPPFPTEDIQDIKAYLPNFLHHLPTASIHYRWAETDETDEQTATNRGTSTYATRDKPYPAVLHWPIPIHHVLFGYQWLTQNYAPPNLQRRSVYVHGSYLGASLAAALALTESHSHQPMAVRGLLAFNGIYNWTTFLPDHPINRIKTDSPFGELDMPVSDGSTDSDFYSLKYRMPALFREPSNLFDPFASPVLFFYNPSLLIPDSFNESTLSPSLLSAIDQLSGSNLNDSNNNDNNHSYGPDSRYYDDYYDELTSSAAIPEDASAELGLSTPPRKGYLAFPPRQSTLKIPETLLLHETSSPVKVSPDLQGMRRKLAWKRAKEAENNFQTQARELATVMRRSINLLEFKERKRWDFEFDDSGDEAEQRVGVADIGEAGLEFEVGERGQELASLWLEERMR